MIAIISKADAFLTNDKGLRRINKIEILILDELDMPEPDSSK